MATNNQFGMPQPVMGGGGPMRIKKKPGLLQSIVGVFIGILLILGSPIAMWQAGDQHRADDFASAAKFNGGANGYMQLRGNPVYADRGAGADCHAEGCAYEEQRAERLVTEQELQCGTVTESESVRILYQDGYEYDEDTGEATPCYQVERDEWRVESTEVLLYDVTVMAPLPEGGDLTTVDPLPVRITAVEGAIYLDTEEDIVIEETNDAGKAIRRTVYTSFVLPDQLLVVGEYARDNAVLSPSVEKAYVWSAFDEATTRAKLQDMDAQARIGLWIAAFGMLFIGFSMIFGPLEWAARMFGRLPIVGRVVSQGSRGLITLIALLLAAIFWVIIWFLVTLIQIWWLGLLFLIVVGLLVWLFARKR